MELTGQIMPSTTPLLLLLDSVLSQNVDLIREARNKIHQMAQEAGYVSDGTDSDSNVPGTPSCLAQDVNKLLTGYPHLASVPSTRDGSLPLHFAASIGNVEVARIIMAKFPTAATTPNAKGKIPLHYAAREGRIDMVVYFLKTTPQTAQIRSKKDKLALHFAAGDGYVDVVRELLSVYPQSASIPSSKGKLPIHFASRWGNLQIATDLLHVCPESVEAADHEGSLPLHEAAREGQFEMSELLIEKFPAALSTTNIRGETPLFAAVRRGDLDIVILYLRAWPHGGRHILKSLTSDDNVEDWDPRMLELLLRSVVVNFIGCEGKEGKDPPTYFGMKPSESDNETEIEVELDTERHRKTKKLKRNLESHDSNNDLVENQLKPRTYLPLHAALACEASLPVLCCVLKRGSDGQLKKVDDYGQLPLHLAVAHCNTKEENIKILLDEILKPYPDASMVRDNHGRLPLHVALMARADFRIIEALVKANSASGVDKCRANIGSFKNKVPMYIATEYDCDLSTTYLLLRLNPSITLEWDTGSHNKPSSQAK